MAEGPAFYPVGSKIRAVVRLSIGMILPIFALAGCFYMPSAIPVVTLPVGIPTTPELHFITNPPTSTPSITGTLPTVTRSVTPGLLTASNTPIMGSSGSPSILTRTPAGTPTPTRTPTPSAAAVHVDLLIRTCDTGLDIAHGMGEVTNAYLTVQNLGSKPASDLVLLLSSPDEDRSHPDKQYQLKELPVASEVSVKLTVDTQNGVDSSVIGVVTVSGVEAARAETRDCKQRIPERPVIQRLGKLGEVRPILPNVTP